MAKSTKPVGAVKATKPVGAEAPEAHVAVEQAQPATAMKTNPAWGKATKAKVKALIAAGREITGAESVDLIDTLHAELESEDTEEITEQEEVDGVPNQLPVRTEAIKVANKDYNFPVFFVAETKKGPALYNEKGKRVSPASTDPKVVSKLNKDCARFNAIRRTSRTAADFARGDF